MAKACFCGCGFEVPFGRRRIANELGEKYDDQLAIFGGALDRGTLASSEESDLREIVVTGGQLRETLRGIVHGTVDREDFDKAAGRAWLKRAMGMRDRLSEQLIADGYAGWDALELVHAGRRAPAVVEAVTDTGTTVNTYVRVEVRLRVEPDGEPPFEAERKLLVSRIAFPRRGERVEVFYHPDDRSRFTFRTAELTDDPPSDSESRLDALSKLGELRAGGVLTEAEFEAEKQRILSGEA